MADNDARYGTEGTRAEIALSCVVTCVGFLIVTTNDEQLQHRNGISRYRRLLSYTPFGSTIIIFRNCSLRCPLQRYIFCASTPPMLVLTWLTVDRAVPIQIQTKFRDNHECSFARPRSLPSASSSLSTPRLNVESFRGCPSFSLFTFE